MKQAVVLSIFVLFFGILGRAHGAQILLADFGNVNQGTAKTITLEFDSTNSSTGGLVSGDGTFTATAAFPFKVSPATGEVHQVRNSSITITLPANTPIGVFDTVTKVVITCRQGTGSFDIPTKAAIVGYPYKLDPETLDMGTQPNGILKVTNQSLSKETFSINLRNFGIQGGVSKIQVNAGQTASVTLTVLDGLSAPVTETVAVKDERTNLSRSIVVKAQPGVTKPDLVPTVVAVKVFPPSGGESTIQVTYRVQNNGFASSVPCASEINLDTAKVLDVVLPAIGPGLVFQDVTTTVVFKTTAPAGSHKVKFFADTNNKNNETVENNNVSVKDITIQ